MIRIVKYIEIFEIFFLPFVDEEEEIVNTHFKQKRLKNKYFPLMATPWTGYDWALQRSAGELWNRKECTPVTGIYFLNVFLLPQGCMYNVYYAEC